MWLEPSPASGLLEQGWILIVPLTWTLQGLPASLEKPAQRIQGLNPHCTLTWLRDQLAWSTFASIHVSKMQIQAHSCSDNVTRARWAPRVWMYMGGWFPTAPGRAGLVTGRLWGCIWRDGRSAGASCPSRDKSLSCIVTTRELLFSTASLCGQSSSIRFSWNTISLLIHLEKAFWF